MASLIKNILLTILVFILVSNMVHAFNKGSTIFNWDNTPENTYTFTDTAMWNDHSFDKFGDTFIHSIWAPRTAGGTTYHKMDFTKDFWQPIEPWEYEVCSRGLSTQLAPKSNQVGIGGSIYDITITATASQFIPEGNNTYLYELSWYIHPNGVTGEYYTINLMGPNGVDDVVKEKTGAGQRRGDQGYITFYSVKNYTKIKLIYNGTPYTFGIASAKDMNRRLI